MEIDTPYSFEIVVHKVALVTLKIFGKTKLRNTRKRKIEISNILDHRICMSAMILSQITGIKKIKEFLKKTFVF